MVHMKSAVYRSTKPGRVCIERQLYRTVNVRTETLMLVLPAYDEQPDGTAGSYSTYM